MTFHASSQKRFEVGSGIVGQAFLVANTVFYDSAVLFIVEVIGVQNNMK